MQTLILNPVENLPDLFKSSVFVEYQGLYVSDKKKTDDVMKASKIAFSGRGELNNKVQTIYKRWATALNASKLSMRLLSGLHAHVILFMGLGNIGDTVLLLPEEAGGHYATTKILKRLGYRVVHMVADNVHHCVNAKETVELIKATKPNIFFVDRSEGLNYEDFSWLTDHAEKNVCCVFDASQYLTNIMFGDLRSPFDMGFDLMMATLHKNFPGPQKALVCSQSNSIFWNRVESAMSDYVSSLHIATTLEAGEQLSHEEILREYSAMMLQNSVMLEEALTSYGLPMVQRNKLIKPTHHLWMTSRSSHEAFAFFKRMEENGLLVNYRKLPYALGYGIRMGVSAATLQGLNSENIEGLAELIACIYHQKGGKGLFNRCQTYIKNLHPLPKVTVRQRDSI